MHTTSESLIVELAIPGNTDAWNKFVRLYSPLLYHWVCRSGLQDSDAADCVQEVFSVLVAKLPEFHYDRNQSFRSWLRAITLNVWRNHCRQRARRVPTVEHLEEQAGQDDLYTETQYRQEMFQQAMVVLEPEFQSRTWLAFVEYGVKDRPVNDVARELEMTTGAVYVARCRVVGRIKVFLQGLLD